MGKNLEREIIGTFSGANEMWVGFMNGLPEGELACVDGVSGRRSRFRGIVPSTDWSDR